MKHFAPVFLSLGLLAVPAFAVDSPGTASGAFKSQAIVLEAKSAVAFHGKSLQGDGTALIVALSNVRLNADAIADYVDRRRVIETRVKDGQTGVVYFEFRPDGSFRGMSYDFGPGNGCTFCSGDVASGVKLVDGKLSGKLTGTDKDRSFDITLATSVMADVHGAALPADGGEPGKAYLRFHDALVKGDRAALRSQVSKDQQAFLDESEKSGKLAATIHSMAESHPAKSLVITNGFATDAKAVVLFTGETTSGKVTGEALLLNEGGVWRVDDEIAAPE
jgi:hypothetical protein